MQSSQFIHSSSRYIESTIITDTFEVQLHNLYIRRL